MIILSVDIETFGLSRSSVIASIGFAVIDTKEARVLESGSIYPSTVEQYRSFGRTMDPGTVLWWMGQSGEARENLIVGQNASGTSVYDSLMWLTRIWNTHRCQAAVGNGPGFDLDPIEQLCRLLGLQGAPWSHRETRCLRTMKDLARLKLGEARVDELLATCKVGGPIAHIAVDDAIVQGLSYAVLMEELIQ